MAKVKVQVVRAFSIYNAGDVIGLTAEELKVAGANVRPVEAPGSNRMGPPPESLRDVVSDGEIAASKTSSASPPAETELVTATPKARSRKKRG